MAFIIMAVRGSTNGAARTFLMHFSMLYNSWLYSAGLLHTLATMDTTYF